MFKTSSAIIDLRKDNIVVNKNIFLDENLECFIVISSNDKKLVDLTLNKILDSIINKISIKNTYDDFSIALEAINAFIKTWEKNDWEDDKYELDIIIWILNRNNFIFSNIWSSSCYLVKENKEIVEITERNENKSLFDYVSSGELNNWEIIVMWTKRLLSYLSNSDLLDWNIQAKIEDFVKNIKYILKSEILDHNIWICAIKYNTFSFHSEKQWKLIHIKHLLMRFADNRFVKKALASYLIAKDYISTKSKSIKNIFFLIWAITCFIILFFIITKLVEVTNNSKEKEEARIELIEAKKFIKLASENVTNTESFKLNIWKSEEIIKEIKDKELYLNDIKKIEDDINIVKKQFNKVEIYETNEDNILFSWNMKDAEKIMIIGWKYYVIMKKWVIWPILPWWESEEKVFDKLEDNEHFVDWVDISNELFLLTNLSNIVHLEKTWHFRFVDVDSQARWESAKQIDSYSKNIYLLWKEDNQIYKHKYSWKNFLSSSSYLPSEDLNEIWEIVSIWIDWWIYLLKKDLSLLKMFKDPKYRLEIITINNRPQNYDIENPESKIDIKTSPNLNYFYMLLNNKIWVFEPNTRRFQDTKSISYIGQIEAKDKKIIDFYVNYDWEAIVLDDTWVSKLEFEITDSWIIIR